MQWLILGVIGIGWVIFKIIEGISDASTASANRRKMQAELSQKYGNRSVDRSKSLFERNVDIIHSFESKIKAHSTESSYSYRRRYSSGSYYIENETRDCINEVAVAEGNFSARPNSAYLSNWRSTVPKDWVQLSEQIEALFRQKQKQLLDEERRIQEARAEEQRRLDEEKRRIKHENDRVKDVERQVGRTLSTINSRIANKVDPLALRNVSKRGGKSEFLIEDLSKILRSNESNWMDNRGGSEARDIVPFPRFETDVKLASVEELNQKIDEFNKTLENDKALFAENKKYFASVVQNYKKGSKEDVIQYFNYVIDAIELPSSMPKRWILDFDPDQGILIAEIGLPDVVHSQVLKTVQLKEKVTHKPLNQKELKDEVPKIHPAMMLRVAYEIYKNDTADIIKLLVVNGWVEFDDPASGNKTRTYTASLAAEKHQITTLNLQKLDPLAAFLNLKGKSAGKLIDIIPVTPVMSLDKKDKRFIETKEVLNKLGSETNLASMDWQDFESLIAELFEKEFADEGAEIKVTQASRDRGVDAVIFNPDPIKGGKYIVQAKRYTNTVDVSAVRDLCAVVKKEGASKGILVTTSTYGADAYSFAQNEPITLLNGAELLGLLNKHGYKFKINLAEARKLQIAQGKNY